MRSSCCFLHASSLSFIILLVFTICSQDNYIYAHRIEWQEFRHLASGVGGESVTSATAVLWDNSSADDHSSETLKEKNSNSDEVFTNKEYKGRKQKKGFYMDCVPLDVCQYCTGDVTTAKSKNDEGTIVPVECMDTGKRQRFECIIEESETATSSSSSSSLPDSTGSSNSRTEVIYQSCKSTPEEDYFAVVRMQFICLVLGIFSLREVNKQKRLSASMFDQRKYYSSGSSGGGSATSSTSAGSAHLPPHNNNKVTRKTSDASVNYSPVPTNDIAEDTTPGSNSKAKPSSTSNKNTTSTTMLNFAESAV